MSGRRWTVLAVREGDAGSRRFRVSARRLAAILGLAGLAVATVAFGFGLRAGGHRATAELQAFEARFDSVTEENAKVVALAARMEELEASYERLRGVMAGEVAPSARDILLPPVRSDEPGRRRGDSGSSGHPALWPLVEAGFVTRAFGDSIPGEEPHTGLDIAVPVGSYVRAVGSGVVVEAGEDLEYGRFLRIGHDDGLRSLYAHNSWTFVSPGDSVEAGEVIALSGNTGRSTAPHLHLEVEQGGTRVDPLPFVSDRS